MAQSSKPLLLISTCGSSVLSNTVTTEDDRDPVPPSTHELYTWSDGSTGRAFGHYADSAFVVDSLGDHL